MLTSADVYGRRMVNATHVDYSRSQHAWIGNVDGIPRLRVAKGRDKTGNFMRWYVDEKHVRDLDTALAVLNGVKTLEEAVQEAEQVIPPEAQRPGKVSIQAQIDEIDYELDQRKAVYARIAASNPAKGRENEMHVERMKAVRGTLVWLQQNEAAIKQRASY